MSEHNTINISTVTLLKVIFVGLLIWFLWVIRDVLLIFLISVIVSSAIDPLADWLSKWRVPRSVSVIFVYIIFLAFIVLAGFLIVPTLNAQFNQIRDADVLQNFATRLGLLRQSLTQSSVGRAIDTTLRNNFSNFGNTLFTTTKGVLSGIVSAITILVISFYLTIEENGLKNFVKHLVPYKNQAYIMKLVNKIQWKMGAWVIGQVILSAMIFGLVFIGLTVLHVQYALVLALIAAIFEIVPYIGPFISGTIGVFFAFLQAPALAVAVLILWVVAQQLEAHVIVPIVMSRSVGLSPVLIILGILIGGTLGGIVGALIAIPVISGFSVFVTDLMESNAESS